MINNKNLGRIIFNIVNYTLLAVIAIVIIFPILHVMASSLSNHTNLSRGLITIYPKGLNFVAYQRVIGNDRIWQSYGRTLTYTSSYIVISLTITALGAYVLSRRNFFGRNFLIGFVLFPLMFNAGLVPTYLVVNGIGLYNSMWAIVLVHAIFTYYLIIMRTFFQQIPYELEEAAIIDGCSHLRVLIHMILPLSIPALITIGLFYGVYQWNNYLYPMLFLKDRIKFPIQLVLREIVLQNQTDEMFESASGSNIDTVSESIKYAVIVVASLPIIIVYPFLQKYFVKGVLVGAVKG